MSGAPGFGGPAVGLGVFAATFALYWGSAVAVGHRRTPRMAYFDVLARAFLDRKLYLARPPAVHDLTFHRGRWYVPFPPLPALLMLPWVAWRGVERTNTVVVSAALGAASAGFVYCFLDALSLSGASTLSRADNLWLTLLFAFGTVFWWVSIAGAVWLLGQVSAVAFVALAAWWAAAGLSPWLVGTAFALALGGRPSVIFSWPLLLGIAAETERATRGTADAAALLSWGAISLVPVALAVAALLVYNRARFGSFSDFGYREEIVAAHLKDDLRDKGQFNVYYLPRNLRYMLLAPPRWDGERRRLLPDPYGMSLFLTTPALVFLFAASPRSPLALGAWVSVAAVGLLVASYYASGWWQFGYRFSLDFAVPLVALLAVAAETVGEPGVGAAMIVLIVASVAINGWGLRWLYSKKDLYG